MLFSVSALIADKLEYTISLFSQFLVNETHLGLPVPFSCFYNSCSRGSHMGMAYADGHSVLFKFYVTFVPLLLYSIFSC